MDYTWFIFTCDSRMLRTS